jgi:hypothetical protein
VPLVQKRLAQVGVAKQTAKGSAAAAATYQIGVTGGNIVGAEVAENDLNVTWSTRLTEGFERTGITPMAEYDAIAMPKTLGLMLYGACGAIATSGASAPYTHTITTSADVPYLSLFGTYGAEYYKVTDAKVDSLELSWEQTSALKMKPKFVGAGLSYLAAAYTATNSERPADGILRGQGGTFTFDGAAATVKSGSITVSNNVEAVFGSADVLPVDVFPGLQTVEFSLTVIPSDMTTWRKRLTGSAAGTSLVSTVYTGAVTIKHVLDANTDITFTANNAAFATDFPEADPAGGPAEITIEGKVGIPAGGGTAYSFALRNSVATY